MRSINEAKTKLEDKKKELVQLEQTYAERLAELQVLLALCLLLQIGFYVARLH